jgi:hypothetical protein
VSPAVAAVLLAGDDGRLQLVRTGAPGAQRLFEQVFTFGDHRRVEAAAVLLGAQHDLAALVGAGGQAGVGEQQQRQQPGHLGLAGQQRMEGLGSRQVTDGG